MTVTLAKWSLDDYHQMIDAGILRDRQVELLNGEIIKRAPEGPEHAQLSTDAADYLRTILGSQVLIRDAKPITLPDSNSEPEPDVAVVQPLRQLYRTRHPYPENIFWLIEYASSSLAKDLDAKRSAYARAGILEYWVVNLKKRCLIVLKTPEAGDYQQESVVSDGVLSPLAFPEAQISVHRLLEG
ncbi:MAG: Uma2 family endonuclease [Leptolyngbyaceae cyanobacterium MO_188.B28]|nr:Uma2 family endonuclease [Leptolyngbyaceae cyanobacterium MO_188.B28]